jgi:hypothetical protein
VPQVFAKALGINEMQHPEIVIMSTDKTQDGRVNYLLSVFNEAYPGKWTYWSGLSHWFLYNESLTDLDCRAGELQVGIVGDDFDPNGFDIITTILVKGKGMSSPEVRLDFSSHERMKEIIHGVIYSAVERRVEGQQ